MKQTQFNNIEKYLDKYKYSDVEISYNRLWDEYSVSQSKEVFMAENKGGMKVLVWLVVFLAIVGIGWFSLTKVSLMKKQEKLSAGEAIIATLVIGDVEIKRTGSEGWETLLIDDLLVMGDEVRTGGDSYCELQMVNRGVFRLEGNTQLEVAKLENIEDNVNATMSLSSGSIALNPKSLKAEETFEVETSTAVAAVRGTKFSVKVDDSGDTKVSVVEGSVAVSPNLSSLNKALEEGLVDEDASEYLKTSLASAVTVSPGEEVDLKSDVVKTLDESIDKAVRNVHEKQGTITKEVVERKTTYTVAQAEPDETDIVGQVIKDVAEKTSVDLSKLNTASGSTQPISISIALMEKKEISDEAKALLDQVSEENIIGDVLEMSKLTVNSDPAGAIVKVDGIIMGKTPYTQVVEQGSSHKVIIIQDGYEQYSEKVEINEAKMVMNAVLTELEESAVLTVKSEPSGATVMIDGSKVGTTPYTQEVAVDSTVEVEVMQDDYETYSETVKVSGEDVNINAQLEASIAMRTVTVKSTPSGADVLMDGVYVGSTPYTKSVQEGTSFEVTVEQDGYENYSQSVTMTKDTTVSASLVAMKEETTETTTTKVVKQTVTDYETLEEKLVKRRAALQESETYQESTKELEQIYQPIIEQKKLEEAAKAGQPSATAKVVEEIEEPGGVAVVEEPNKTVQPVMIEPEPVKVVVEDLTPVTVTEQPAPVFEPEPILPGDRIWQTDINFVTKVVDPVYYMGYIFATSGTTLYILSTEGQVVNVVSVPTDGNLTKPEVGNDTIFVGSDNGGIWAYDVTGRLKWSSVEAGNQMLGGISPEYSDGIVAAASSDKGIIIYEADSGSIVNRIDLDTQIFAKPIILNDGNLLVYGTQMGNIIGYDLNALTELWNKNYVSKLLFPIIGNDESIVILDRDDGSIYGINPQDGEMLWEEYYSDLMKTKIYPVYKSGKVAFVNKDADTVYLLSASSGSLLLKKEMSDINASPFINGEWVYIGNDRGEILAVNYSTGEEWTAEVEGAITVLASDDENVYAVTKNSMNSLAAIERMPE